MILSHYSAYGLVIASNRPLPGAPASVATDPDVTIAFRPEDDPGVDPQARAVSGASGWYSISDLPDGARLYRCAADAGTRVWSMEADPRREQMVVRWSADVDIADVLAFVMTRGLAAFLAARRCPLLHACAIEVSGEAVLVAGASGAGKSTMGATAVATGHALLADDIAALTVLDGRVHVLPGVQRMRLDEHSARAAGWDPARLPGVFADPRLVGKRVVELCPSGGSFCAEPRVLAAIHVLSTRRAAGPEIIPLAPELALPALLSNTYGSDLLGRDAQADQLPLWARIAEDVPVFRVHAADDVSAVPATLAAMLSSHSASAAIPASNPTSGR